MAADTNPPPAFLGEGDIDSLGDRPFGVDAYVSPAFHRAEIEKVWARCWLVVCREDELAKVGDFVVYDLAELSALIVRDRDGTLRAFVNSCPHRGTRLCDENGHALRIRCPFRAMTWTLDGAIKDLTCAWDFPAAQPHEFDLEAVRLGVWGGFVFVNFDDKAESLEAFLGDLPRHFERWPLEKRFTAAHVAKRFDCNWKISIEAFIETFHVIGLHPEALPFFGDVNSQYDIWRGEPHFSRMINPSGVASPHVADRITPQRIADGAARMGLCAPGPLGPGETPRVRIAAHLRGFYEGSLGVDFSEISDSEVMDVIEYNLFPNLVACGGFGSPLAYRSRPDGDNPNHSIFEVWMLLPYPEGAPRPPSAPLRMLGKDEKFGDVPELSYYGPVLDQDADMMHRVQAGLRSSRSGKVRLSRYQEIRIRQMRETLAAYLAK